MTNEEIARRFHRLSALMEIRGDDPFRLRSYRNAAEAIEVWPTSLKEIASKEGVAGLQTIPGVGKAIAGKVMDLLERGTFDAWERLIAETPETVLDLTDIPGILPCQGIEALKVGGVFQSRSRVRGDGTGAAGK